MSASFGGTRAGRPMGVPVPWLDRLAIGASFACLAHCLIFPMLIAASPALAHMLDVPEAFHLYVLATTVPVSALAMARGFRRHGLWLPMGLGAVGLALLAFGALAGLPALYETGLTLGGSLILAIAHVRNWQLHVAQLTRSPLLSPASGTPLNQSKNTGQI